MILLFLGGMELILIVPVLILYIYCIAHCINNKNLTFSKKMLWVLIILIGNILGCLLYLVIGKKEVTRSAF
jgi:L-cystine uptake protein TcyP (sodium:dicarboxylate symporter family)